MQTRSLLTALLVAVIACSGSSTSPGSAGTPGGTSCLSRPGTGVGVVAGAVVTTWSVLPQSTDNCITQRLDSHFVMRAPGVAAAGRLFVFFPGTGAIPQYYKLIVKEAATAGYHAIGLAYQNAQAIGTLCIGQPTSCYGLARLETLTRTDASALVAVDRPNSIESRIVRLLRIMVFTDASGSWSQFLVNDSSVGAEPVRDSGRPPVRLHLAHRRTGVAGADGRDVGHDRDVGVRRRVERRCGERSVWRDAPADDRRRT